MLTLYTYFRSSAAYRVRIALGLKGLPYDSRAVHLVKDGGQQHTSAYRALNPQALVPSLQTATAPTDGSATLTQSLAIMEYLEEAYPQAPALLPADLVGRARVRALAQVVACEIHPLNNLRVLRYLTQDMGLSSQQKDAWYAHWIALGLGALEEMLATSSATGQFCHGDSPTLADCCLVPQIFNGKRFGVNLDGLPLTMAAFDACMALPAFAQAQPSACPDNAP